MPRTKVSKSSKRNRDAAIREEKIRDFETSLDGYINHLERVVQEDIDETESELRMLVQRTSPVLLKMKVSDFLALDLDKFCDWTQDKSELLAISSYTNMSQSICNTTASSVRPAKSSNPNDEGYLTEDSSNGALNSVTLAAYTSLATIGNFQQQQPQQEQLLTRGRTPGPLSSARARRPRRSRSACSDHVPGSAHKPSSIYNGAANTTTSTDRSSRSKLRTPTAPRPKAFSADRSIKVAAMSTLHDSPPTAFMRWPKPGELVLSTCGSPVVAQVMPDKFANVNIPVRNGVLSLRPKKLSELQPDILEGINAETLNQIKTLHANLNFIVTMADKAANSK